MGDFCSGYCARFNKCDQLGILDYMKVIPIHPNRQPKKNWCKSFEEENNKKEN